MAEEASPRLQPGALRAVTAPHRRGRSSAGKAACRGCCSSSPRASPSSQVGQRRRTEPEGLSWLHDPSSCQ
eukprot:9194694-Lingulodinium_polyedra.AAC.1